MTINEFFSQSLDEATKRLQIINAKINVGEDGEVIDVEVEYGVLHQLIKGRYVQSASSRFSDERL